MSTPYTCDECGHQSPSQQGLRAHKTRTHSKTSPDELFELVGRATEALFPNGVPASRIIEIAALQREMLKTVTR